MTRHSPQIPAGSPLVGDRIRATWTDGDTVRTVEGRVGCVIYNGTQRTFKDANGHELYEWNLNSPLNPTVELIDAAPMEQEPLPGM